MHPILVNCYVPVDLAITFAKFSQCFVVTPAAIGTRTYLWSKIVKLQNTRENEINFITSDC